MLCFHKVGAWVSSGNLLPDQKNQYINKAASKGAALYKIQTNFLSHKLLPDNIQRTTGFKPFYLLFIIGMVGLDDF